MSGRVQGTKMNGTDDYSLNKSELYVLCPSQHKLNLKIYKLIIIKNYTIGQTMEYLNKKLPWVEDLENIEKTYI